LPEKLLTAKIAERTRKDRKEDLLLFSAIFAAFLCDLSG